MTLYYSVVHLGSPPPTRGTLNISKDLMKAFGITPAYAGNTHRAFRGRCGLRDHPRLRGEHYAHAGEKKPIMGSPPPTRGTRNKLCDKCVAGRITPAYAGNTNTQIDRQLELQDHPRLRGEHVVQRIELNRLRGSPPPTRGTHYDSYVELSTMGITPAYAGNTYNSISPGQGD